MGEGKSHKEQIAASAFPRGLRRFRNSWAQTFQLGRFWRLDVEWIPKARSFDFWLYDSRRNDGV